MQNDVFVVKIFAIILDHSVDSRHVKAIYPDVSDNIISETFIQIMADGFVKPGFLPPDDRITY